jgi:hypothetical protein
MTDFKIGTREEWLAARLELLKEGKALTRRSDEMAQWRQRLPWVRIDKEYRFETDGGMASLAWSKTRIMIVGCNHCNINFTVLSCIIILTIEWKCCKLVREGVVSR